MASGEPRRTAVAGDIAGSRYSGRSLALDMVIGQSVVSAGHGANLVLPCLFNDLLCREVDAVCSSRMWRLAESAM